MKAEEVMPLNGLTRKSIQYCVQGGKSIKGEVRQHKEGLYILKTYNLTPLN